MEPGAPLCTVRSTSGRTVVLRYIKDADVDAVWAYANALIAEDTYVLLSGTPKTREEEARFVADAVAALADNRKIQVVVEVDGAFAGLCDVTRQPSRKSHVGVLGISIAPPYRNDGIGRACITALIAQSKAIGLRMLTLLAFENNPRARHLYESLGFKTAGIIPGIVAYRGAYIGEVMMYKELV